jgi:prephenate dehydrogenase
MIRRRKIAIIGLGLIGGSLAKSFQKLHYISEVIGVDASQKHADLAMELGLVDRIAVIEEAVQSCDIIVLATPVHIIVDLLPKVLEMVEDQVVFDVGSTKKEIIDSVANHPKRGRFVPCHPMSGTEFSGPEAAVDGLFEGKYNVICDQGKCDADALEIVKSICRELKMELLFQEAEEHDTHVAYVSHISHISAFALALTVLNKEESEERIFQLASGGFRSSVRLAKSNPVTWSPIFAQNRHAILDVLDEHITVLSKFRSLIIKDDWDSFSEMMEKANDIKRILNHK